MKITDALLGEHGALYPMMDNVEATLKRATTMEECQAAIGPLLSALISHAKLEDALLFPAIEEGIGPDGPLAVMHAEHERIEELFDRAMHARSAAEARDYMADALELTREHFGKEERVLFSIAQRVIPAERLQQLGDDWAESRRVSLAM
ncbi:MAG: hemerythrin domain-containing protein [Myxococcota bacterium]